jgi:hypothetical protein
MEALVTSGTGVQQVSSNGRLVPQMNLGEIYAAAYSFNPRASFSKYPLGTMEQDHLNFLSGTSLCIAGNMPVLCSRSTVDPRALRLLELTGLAIGSRLVVYDDAASYLEILNQPSRRWVVQHIHPVNEIPPKQYWIQRDLLAFLNNKANLGNLVSKACVPARRSFAKGSPIERKAVRYPVVVKVASDESISGGLGVRICRDAAAFEEALELFGTARRLILESHLPIRRNLCIQFAILPDGTVSYIGAAEQVIDAKGAYLGNWLDQTLAPSPAAKLACRLAAERAARAGYRGVAGFDTAELGDGRVFIFDINFRLNGSTLPLFFHQALTARYGKPVLRTRFCKFSGSYRQLLAHLERWSGDGKFIPFAIQRPQEESQPARVFGVLMGKNRAEVTALAEQWAELGFA